MKEGKYIYFKIVLKYSTRVNGLSYFPPLFTGRLRNRRKETTCGLLHSVGCSSLIYTVHKIYAAANYRIPHWSLWFKHSISDQI